MLSKKKSGSIITTSALAVFLAMPTFSLAQTTLNPPLKRARPRHPLRQKPRPRILPRPDPFPRRRRLLDRRHRGLRMPRPQPGSKRHIPPLQLHKRRDRRLQLPNLRFPKRWPFRPSDPLLPE
jgi:hypothetical protein